MNYNYAVPVTYVPEDNWSYINKQTINIQDCSVFTPTKLLCTGYNFNKCPNDDAYCNPFIIGDKLYFQFLVDKKVYDTSHITFQLINSGGVTIGGYESTTNTGFLNGVYYVNIRIDSGDITDGCFYLKLVLPRLDNAPDDIITSEPYCPVRCEENTLLIEGVYPAYDCNKNYYGSSLGSPAYKPQVRVRGTVEPQGYKIDKTSNGLNDMNTVKSKQSERFILFTEKIPYYVAQKLAICFNSKQLIIDGISYKGETKLDKNFEEGSEWIIKEEIFIDCDELNFTCDV